MQESVVNSGRKNNTKRDLYNEDETPIGYAMEGKNQQLPISGRQNTDRKINSSKFDEIDDIYFEKDPIGISLI